MSLTESVPVGGILRYSVKGIGNCAATGVLNKAVMKHCDDHQVPSPDKHRPVLDG